MFRTSIPHILMAGFALSFVGGKGCAFDRDVSLNEDVCDLPADPGNCDAYMPSYYFSKSTGRCENFVYGGCDGNKNRFSTYAECRTTCGGPPETDGGAAGSSNGTGGGHAQTGGAAGSPSAQTGGAAGSSSVATGGAAGAGAQVDAETGRDAAGAAFCGLAPEAGPCEAYVPSYYYNSAIAACESFVYGGCNGNANRFETRDACEAACSGQGTLRVHPCPDPLPESNYVVVSKSLIVGNSLRLFVDYGGCSAKQFDVCFGPAFAESNPVQTTFHLTYTAADNCSRMSYASLHFDLTPLADTYKSAYASQGGTIRTNYGDYVFGNLSCSEQTSGASAEIAAAIKQTRTACTQDSDCRPMEVSTSCTAGCYAIASSADSSAFEPDTAAQSDMSAAELSASIAAVENDICAVARANGCPAPISLPCMAPLKLRCKEKVCVAAEE